MRHPLIFAVLACVLPLAGCMSFWPFFDQEAAARASQKAQEGRLPWFAVPATEESWTYVDFGSNGGVELAGDDIIIHQGERLEGLKYVGGPADLLGASLDHYEIKLEVQRTGGHDILLGLTFPVGTKESASLVLGGWGGSVCGISSVDEADASGNAWKSIHSFEDGKWYAVALRVDDTTVAATLDGKPLFNVPRAGHHFGLRAEVAPTAPLGLFTFGTSAKVRGFSVRQFK